jgi:hypothetical protein
VRRPEFLFFRGGDASDKGRVFRPRPTQFQSCRQAAEVARQEGFAVDPKTGQDADSDDAVGVRLHLPVSGLDDRFVSPLPVKGSRIRQNAGRRTRYESVVAPAFWRMRLRVSGEGLTKWSSSQTNAATASVCGTHGIKPLTPRPHPWSSGSGGHAPLVATPPRCLGRYFPDRHGD